MKAALQAHIDLSFLAALSSTGLNDRERRAAWGRLISREKWKQSRRRGGGRRRRAASAAAAEARGAGHGGAEVLQQVRMDVARAFHWDVCRAWGAAKRASSLSALALVLDGVFPAAAQQAFPFYVQGCHDVAGVLLLSLGPAQARLALAGLVRGPLRGCVQSSMEVPCALLGLLPRLLHEADGALGAALEAASPAQDALPHYALPWLITWFAHSLDAFAVVQRLFDAFLLAHPLLPLYASAALLTLPGPAAALHACLRAAPGDEGALFQACAGLPAATLTSQEAATLLLRRANALYALLPPAQLLQPWGAAAPQGGPLPRHARHGAAVAVLQRQWPQLLKWEPVGGVDPRLQGQQALPALAGAGGRGAGAAPPAGGEGRRRQLLLWAAAAVAVAAVGVAVVRRAGWW